MKHEFTLQYFESEWKTFCFANDVLLLKNIAYEHNWRKWRILGKRKKVLAEFCSL